MQGKARFDTDGDRAGTQQRFIVNLIIIDEGPWRMHLADLMGYGAAICVFIAFYMKTMVPLRVAGIISNLLFIAYGYYAQAYPVLYLHLALLPLNILRLYQIKQLLDNLREASSTDLNMDWLKPFSNVMSFSAGEVVFRKGDTAHDMMIVASGRFRLTELDLTIENGAVVGELGLLSPDQTRTATLTCEQDGSILMITYERLRQVYFQNREFGFYFLKLTTRRLFENTRRLEERLAALERPGARGAL